MYLIINMANVVFSCKRFPHSSVKLSFEVKDARVVQVPPFQQQNWVAEKELSLDRLFNPKVQKREDPCLLDLHTKFLWVASVKRFFEQNNSCTVHSPRAL